MAQQKPVGSTGQVRTSGINAKQAEQMAVKQHFRFSDKLATISPQFSDSVAVIELPFGEYTYRALTLSVESSAVIAGVTSAEDGTNVVDTAKLVDYIDYVELELNGKVQVSYTVQELIDLNETFRWNVKNGHLWLCFGGPGIFTEGFLNAQDAYLLGTADLRSVKINVKLKAAWAATMKLWLSAEYASVARPVGYLVTCRQQRYQVNLAGEYTISDIQHGVDLAAIWVRGMNAKRINGFKLRVDDQVLFDCRSRAYAALAQLWGRDHQQLGSGNLFIDFWREGNPNKGLAALNTDAQIRKDADIRLTLDMGEAGAELKVITMHCGQYMYQR